MGRYINTRTLYYIAMRAHPAIRDGEYEQAGVLAPNMYGGRPHFHITHEGAAKHATNGGKVLALDLKHLPEAIDDTVTIGAATSPLEFAERQMLAWGRIADRWRNR